MSLERRGGSGKRRRKRGEVTVDIAGKGEVATVDKVMERDGAKKGEMMVEVEEGTAAAGQLRDQLLILLILLIERSLFDIAATVLIITEATVGRTMTMQLQTRAQTVTVQHMCTTGNHHLRSLR